MFAGDWGDNTTVYGAMQETVGREYGRLWSARDGVLNAINRHHLITDKTVDYAITTFSDMDYQYGSSTDIANLVNVRAATRREFSCFSFSCSAKIVAESCNF